MPSQSIKEKKCVIRFAVALRYNILDIKKKTVVKNMSSGWSVYFCRGGSSR